MSELIRLKLNGEVRSVTVEPDRRLLWVLRTDLGLTGCKYGCGQGLCGSCTVLVEKRAVRSCLVPISAVGDQEVTTIEGLAKDGELHPLQRAFIEKGALQCGYCTPGMVLNAYSLLLEASRPSRDQIVQKMEGNLCRCGTHVRVIQAVQAAGREMGGTSE